MYSISSNTWRVQHYRNYYGIIQSKLLFTTKKKDSQLYCINVNPDLFFRATDFDKPLCATCATNPNKYDQDL